jgi:hypothetical protein
MIEDFPRAEVDWVGREDVACRVEVRTPDDLAWLGGGRAACRVEVRTLDDLAWLGGGRVALSS